MRKTALSIALLFAASIARAQVSTPSIVPVATSPDGQACSAQIPIKLSTPDGTLHTCQNGVYGSVSGGGPAFNVPITAPAVNSVQVVGTASTTDLGAEINAAFATCSNNCTVQVRKGTYPSATTVQLIKPTQSLEGLGPKGSVIINYSGSGDAILFQMNPFGGLTITNAGFIDNITVQGTSSGASGLHTGNVIGSSLRNLTVQGFTGAGGKCIWIDNTLDSNSSPGWYERNVWIGVETGANNGLPSKQCTYNTYADNNGATNSIGYNRILDYHYNVVPGTYGIYLSGTTGQVYWYNGTLNTTCNLNSGVSQVGTIPECLTLTNNTFMKYMAVTLNGENNCLPAQSCSGATGYGMHVLSGAQFQSCGNETYDSWTLGIVNDAGGILNFNCTGYNFTYSQPVAGPSNPVVSYIGTPYTGGTGSTNYPLVFYSNNATAPVTTWQAGGTWMGIVAPAGFTGDFVNLYVNNTQELRISATGQLLTNSYGGLVSANDGTFTPGNGSTASKINRNAADAVAVMNLLQQNASSTGDILDLSNSAGIASKFAQNGGLTIPSISTSTNCANGASPAVCVSAASGAVALPAGTGSTLTINTTAIGVNSRISLQIDDTVTIGGTTCNSTLATLVGTPLSITGRVPGTSFTVSTGATVVITANPVCFIYTIWN